MKMSRDRISSELFITSDQISLLSLWTSFNCPINDLIESSLIFVTDENFNYSKLN